MEVWNDRFRRSCATRYIHQHVTLFSFCALKLRRERERQCSGVAQGSHRGTIEPVAHVLSPEVRDLVCDFYRQCIETLIVPWPVEMPAPLASKAMVSPAETETLCPVRLPPMPVALLPLAVRRVGAPFW
jgi:hypothetical protein